MKGGSAVPPSAINPLNDFIIVFDGPAYRTMGSRSGRCLLRLGVELDSKYSTAM